MVASGCIAAATYINLCWLHLLLEWDHYQHTHQGVSCWAWVQIAATMLSSNSLRQTVHTHRASIHQAAKLVAALLRVARVTAGLAESNGSLPPGLWLTSPAGCLPRTWISSGTLHSAIKYGLPLLFQHPSPTQNKIRDAQETNPVWWLRQIPPPKIFILTDLDTNIQLQYGQVQ